MKALFISGSPKTNGSTASVILETARALRDGGIETSIICLGETEIHYCLGCKKCYDAGKCIQSDDMNTIIAAIFASDLIIIASPSYWGDITGQMKVFIDRCTPFCNTNPNRIPVPAGKKGAAIAIRAGMSKIENEHLIATIEHFLGHLDVPLLFQYSAEGIECVQDLEKRREVLKSAYLFGKSISESVF